MLPLFAPLHSTNKQNKHSPDELMLYSITNRIHHQPMTAEVSSLYPFCTPYDNPYVALALASANRQAPQTAEAFPLFPLLLPQTAEVIPCAMPQTTEAFPMSPLAPRPQR